MNEGNYGSNQERRRQRMQSMGTDWDSFVENSATSERSRRSSANSTKRAAASPSGRQSVPNRGQQVNRNRQMSNNMPNDYQKKPKNQKKKKHTLGLILAIIQGILSLAVIGIAFIMNVLPMVYMGLLIAVLVILWLFSFITQFTKKAHVPGKIIAILMSIVLAVGGYYLFITQNMLSQVTNVAYAVDNMVVAVLKDDPAQNIQDASEYTFGITADFESTKLNQALTTVKENIGHDVNTVNYTSMIDQVRALYNGEVQAIIYNENYKGTIEETFETFSVDIRTLDNVEIKTKVDIVAETPAPDVDVTTQPFILYISGNDGYGTVSIKGRSDVNMLVAINPKTKQIAMVSTPRDSYVVFPGISGESRDKLTHAGNYGMDCLMATLENIYGVDIDYYVRVNFTSLIKMVDALGGVTVNSDYEFTALDGRHYVKGPNELDGESALMFARERKNLPGGDFQRGRDQQLLLTAMFQKAMSPTILTSYAGIIASLQDSFVTNMPQEDISKLIKMQLSDGAKWNMVTYAVEGTTGSECCFSTGSTPLSVVYPAEESINKAKTLLGQLINGQVLTDPNNGAGVQSTEPETESEAAAY